MAVHINEETGKSEWFKWIKDLKEPIVEISSEMDSLFAKIRDEGSGYITPHNADDIFKEFNIIQHKEDLEDFFKAWDGQGDVVEAYKQHMISAGKATTGFGVTINKAKGLVKSFGAAMISMGIVWLIGEVISGLAKLGDMMIVTSEEYKEMADEARSRAEEYEEENKALDDLISKYEELSKSSDRDSSTNKEIASLQQEINSLVGYESSLIDDKLGKLDLVNGKHDEEIKKLKEIAYLNKYGEDSNQGRVLQNAYNSSYQAAYKYDANGLIRVRHSDGYVFEDDFFSGELSNTQLNQLNTYMKSKIGENQYLSINSDSSIKTIEVPYFTSDSLASYFEFKHKTSEGLTGENPEDVLKVINTALEALENFDLEDTDLYIGLSTKFDELEPLVATEKADASAWLEYEVEKYLFNPNFIPKQADEVSDLETYFKTIWAGMIEESKVNEVLSNGSITPGQALDLIEQAFREQYPDLYAEYIKRAEEDTARKTNPRISLTLGGFKKASENIKSLQNAYKEFSEEGSVTFDSITKIKEILGTSISNWSDYEKQLLRTDLSQSELNTVMDSLTYAMLENEFYTVGLANATEQEVAMVLKQCGVLDAEKKALEYVTRAKIKDKGVTAVLTDEQDIATDVLSSLADEIGITTNQYLELAAQEIMFGSTNLNTTQKVQAIMNIANACGIAGSAYSSLSRLMEDVDGFNDLTGTQKEEHLKNKDVTINKDTGRLLSNGKVDWEYIDNLTGVVYDTYPELAWARWKSENADMFGDGTKFSTKTGSGSSDDPTKYDITEATVNRINLRSKELEQQEETLENDIDIAENEKNLAEQLEKSNALLGIQVQRKEALNNANKEFYEEIQKIKNETSIDVDSWFDSQGNFTETYYSFLNSIGSGSAQKEVVDLAEKLHTLYNAIRENEDAIADINNSMRDTKDNIEETQIDMFEKQLDDIDHAMEMALNNDPDADASEFYKQKQKVAHEYAEFLRSLDPIKYEDKIRSLETGWWDYQEKLDDIALKEYENLRELEIRYLDLKYNKEQAINSALEKRYDVQRNIRDKQAEIEAELAASKELPEYLEDSSMLFNDNDYKKLNEELRSINDNIITLYDDYTYAINNLTEDEWYKQEEITAQFERQLDVAMDKYELAEKELELTKKRLEYDNILKQRDTRVMVAGRWVQTADPEKVRDAHKELAQIEAEKKNLATTQAEDAMLRSMQSVSDSTNTLKASIENIATMLDNLSEGELARFARTLDVNTIKEFSAGLKTQDYSAFAGNNGVSNVIAPKSKVNANIVYTGIDDKGNLIVEKATNNDSAATLSSQYRYIPFDDFTKSRWGVNIGEVVKTGVGLAHLFAPPVIPQPTLSKPPSTSTYHFTFGDFIIKEKIDNADELIYAFTDKLSTYVDLNKNKR